MNTMVIRRSSGCLSAEKQRMKCMVRRKALKSFENVVRYRRHAVQENGRRKRLLVLPSPSIRQQKLMNTMNTTADWHTRRSLQYQSLSKRIIDMMVSFQCSSCEIYDSSVSFASPRMRNNIRVPFPCHTPWSGHHMNPHHKN